MLIKLAAGCHNKGVYPGLPYLMGDDVGVLGKNTIAGWIPGGTPIMLGK